VSALAPTLQAFFTERLDRQRRASPHTIAAYRDTFRLLLAFASQTTGRSPTSLCIEDLDAAFVAAFLDHLETSRHNSIPTRNGRLAAIHSFFRFAALRHPENSGLIQRVLALPQKRNDRHDVAFLDLPEINALLAAPDRTTRLGRRDHALLTMAVQTGLRVSELTALTRQDLEFGTGPHVRCQGKGRKERVTPLTPQTAVVLKAWLDEYRPGLTDPLFPGPRGKALSRDAVALVVARHVAAATASCPSLVGKTISPHVLRHTCAMQLLHAGVDTSVIALWLGHESLETSRIYLHADLALKERALARTTPPDSAPGRYHPPDALLTFLERL
jgi:site-specific recombinase XerD